MWTGLKISILLGTLRAQKQAQSFPKFKIFANEIITQQSQSLKHGEVLGISIVSDKCHVLLDPPDCITQSSWFSLPFVAPDIYFLAGTVWKLLLPKWRPDQGEERLCSAPLSPREWRRTSLKLLLKLVNCDDLRPPELGYKLFREAFFS